VSKLFLFAALDGMLLLAQRLSTTQALLGVFDCFL
jgi:hypothetical protein